MSQQKKGKVKGTIVNHYSDGDSDTLIKLDDGTQIVYSADAPIPKGHDITAIGSMTTMAIAMSRLHPQLFDKSGRPRKPLRLQNTKYSFMFSATTAVFVTDEIRDETDAITYKER